MISGFFHQFLKTCPHLEGSGADKLSSSKAGSCHGGRTLSLFSGDGNCLLTGLAGAAGNVIQLALTLLASVSPLELLKSQVLFF